MQWQTFLDRRHQHLRALAPVVADAVQRRDTDWPVFHGCYDWHSAVHGLYALHVASRLTGAPRWRWVAESVLLAPGALEAEQRLVAAGGPPGENPYGYAWLLALATERLRTTGRHELDPIAADAARHLHRWLSDLSPKAFAEAAMSNRYPNASWALLNLAQYTRSRDPSGWRGQLAPLTRRLLEIESLLPFDHDQDRTDDFFAPALSRARCLLTLLESEPAARWLQSWLPQDGQLEPRRTARTAHEGGLNFTRAWGLWALWAATGDPRWRAQYVEHIETHMQQPAFWAEDYDRFSHWVPQFGIYAIALSFPEAPAPARSQ